MRKPGRRSATLSSQLSLLSSTRIASAAAVKALVFEAIENNVCSSIAAGSPSLRTP
jgi:hypothetical protein